jgi:hypothetical protein
LISHAELLSRDGKRSGNRTTSFPPSVAPAPKTAAFPSFFPNFFAFSWAFEGGPASFISTSAYEVLHITIIRRELLKQLVTKLQEKNMYKNNSKTPPTPDEKNGKKENRQIQKHLKNTIYKLSAQCRSCPEDSSIPELLPKLLRVLLTL